MYKLKLIICLIASLSTALVAQPPIEFIRTFNNGGTDSFNDIYAVSDGGYIMCGRTARVEFRDWDMFVVRVDGDGDEIWSATFGEDHDSGEAMSIIETDNGDFLIGGGWGEYRNEHFIVLLINGEGEHIWQRDYGVGKCWASY